MLMACCVGAGAVAAETDGVQSYTGHSKQSVTADVGDASCHGCISMPVASHNRYRHLVPHADRAISAVYPNTSCVMLSHER